MRVPRSPFTLALATALALGSAALPARADITVPGADTCTLEKQAKPGQECHMCRAFYGNADHCPESLAAYGFKQQCRSGGASVWSEMWCRAASPSAPKVPPDLIGQLGDAKAKAPPAPTAPPAPPAPPGTDAPAGPGEEPVPDKVLPPGPPPVPPPPGCGCAVPGESHAPLAASLLATLAAAVIALGRRRRG